MWKFTVMTKSGSVIKHDLKNRPIIADGCIHISATEDYTFTYNCDNLTSWSWKKIDNGKENKK